MFIRPVEKVKADGTKVWQWKGRRHREDGPAKIYKNGKKEWFRFGARHRIDGPAVDDPTTKTKEWWIKGKKHREDGPAYIKTSLDKSKIIREEWWLNGKLHREDGPALIYDWPNTLKVWYQNGLKHREDGPAFEAVEMTSWCIKGLMHRLDGPANIYADGREEWWIKDKCINDELRKACKDFDIPLNYKKWTDNEWVWFRLWASQF